MGDCMKSSAARREDVRRLLRLLDEAYDRKAWHGPNLFDRKTSG